MYYIQFFTWIFYNMIFTKLFFSEIIFKKTYQNVMFIYMINSSIIYDKYIYIYIEIIIAL